MKNKLPIFLLFIIIIFGLIISILPLINGIFPITFDQGRDFLWVKNQVDFERPSLIGPSGSLKGVFFGPLWFWLLTIPYLLSSGSPLAMTLFNAIIVFSSVILAAVLFYRHDKLTAYFILFLGFTSPGIRNLTSFAFSQHLLPALTILLIYSFVKILNKGSQLHFILAWFYLGLMFHSEPPIALFSFPSLAIITWLSLKRNHRFTFKTVVLSLLIFFLTLFPLILFDLRHNFIQLKAIINYLMGNNQSLQEITPLPLFKRLIDRPLKFFAAFKKTILNAPNLFGIGLLLTIFYLIKKYRLPKFCQQFWQASLIYLVSLWAILTIYPDDFKFFYLDGIRLIFIIWIALALSIAWKQFTSQQAKKLIIFYLSLTLILNLQPIDFISSLSKKFSNRHKLGSLYINQIKSIDWVYRDAQNKGFKVYVFTPPIYDYSFQYLFFWYGLNQYGYLPEEFSYAPQKPEYVLKKSQQLIALKDKIRPAEDFIYLIVTQGSVQEIADWRFQLKDLDLSLITKHKLKDGTILEKYSIL